jgi:hypothetical protein
MMIALLLVSGVRDRNILMQTVALQFVTMLCGWLAEDSTVVGTSSSSSEFTKRWLFPYLVGVFAYIPSWVVFLLNFYDSVAWTKEDSGREPPAWVEFLLLGELFLFTSFAFPIVFYRIFRTAKQYWQTEIIYATLSLLSKVMLNGFLLSNVFIAGKLYDRDILK